MSWSPFADDVLQDPAQGHAQLLSHCPVHRYADFDPPFFTLSLYADVSAALRDVTTFSSQFGQGPRFTEPAGMLCDAPQHTFFRALVQQAFTPKQVERLRQPILTLTQQLISGIQQSATRQFDLHDELAFPLPVTIIAELLGVPTADLGRFKHYSDIQVAAMGAADPTQYATEQAEFMSYMSGHLGARRALLASAQPAPDDLLTLLAAAQDDAGLIESAQVLSVLNQLLVGGNETTTSLITNAVWRLLQVPERWQQLVANPELAAAVIEESLRFDPPVLGLYRNTTRDITLHGVKIPANSKVYLNYAAANRDPAVFSNANEFLLARPKQRHLAFGLGTHFCLGAPMARLEAEIALQQLAQRLPKLQLLGDGERITPFFLWGRRHLPVSY